MAFKEVKKRSKINFYLYVFNQIESTGSISTKKYSKQQLNYYISQLKKADIIQRVGYGVWEITGKLEDLKTFKQVKKVKDVTSEDIHKIRGHGYVFSIMLPPIEKWDRRSEYLEEQGVIYKDIKQGQSIKLRGHTIWLCTKSLTLYFSPKSSFYSNNADECSARAIMECKETIRALEKILKISLKYGKGWIITESRSHYAEIRNEVSKYYHSKGITQFEVKQFGKTWMIIDNSFNLHELEAIAGNGRSKDDIKKVQAFLNDLRDNPTTFSRVKEEFEEEIKDTLKLMKEQTKMIAELQKQNVMLTDMIQRKL